MDIWWPGGSGVQSASKTALEGLMWWCQKCRIKNTGCTETTAHGKGGMEQDTESEEERPLVARCWAGMHFGTLTGIWWENESWMPKSWRDEGRWLEFGNDKRRSFLKKCRLRMVWKEQWTWRMELIWGILRYEGVEERAASARGGCRGHRVSEHTQNLLTVRKCGSNLENIN